MEGNIQAEILDRVIDCINTGVAGRLVISKLEKNALGADLSVERRGKYREGKIYFQVNSFIFPAKDDYVSKDFALDKFEADKDFYLIFVFFNELLQKISDYVWLVPSTQFLDMLEIVKTQDGKKVLRFESSTDFKTKNNFSKFIISSKGFGKMVLDALSKGGKFDFGGVYAESPFEEKRAINLDGLREFLQEARKDTFAAGATVAEVPRLLESQQLEFQRGEYFYRDIYFWGSKRFVGQEIIYQDSKPIWGMSYIGNVMDKRATSFLRESLGRLAGKCRIGGGSCKYDKREFRYQDAGEGSFDDFWGQEEISLDNKNIYKLEYRGGIISEKI